jgi:hypothetical protein
MLLGVKCMRAMCALRYHLRFPRKAARPELKVA